MIASLQISQLTQQLRQMFSPNLLEVANVSLNLWIPALLTGIIALILGICIVVVFHFFAVKKDPMQATLLATLPGVNCGGCGYASCDAYAEALSSGKEPLTNKCTAGGQDVAKALAAALGKEAGVYIPTVAHVFCQGSKDHTKKRYNYSGTIHCASAAGLFSGPNSCTYGCLGFGDCVTACEFNALYIDNGVAKVNHNKCTACGKCVEICPKKLIHMIPKHEFATKVSCSNHWNAAVVHKACAIGCIACGRCVKECPVNVITLEDNLASISQRNCIHCGKCVKVCPTGAIQRGLLNGKGEGTTADIDR